MPTLDRTFVTPSRAYEALTLVGVNVETRNLPHEPDERISAYLAILCATVQSLLFQRSQHHPDLIRMYYRRARVWLDPETDEYAEDAARAEWLAALHNIGTDPTTELPSVAPTAAPNPLQPWFRHDNAV